MEQNQTNENQPIDSQPKEDQVKEEQAKEEQAKLIDIDKFFETDLRVGVVLAAERVEKTDKLMKLQVDLGEEQRQIVAGIAQQYTPEDLLGKRLVVVANLQPVTLRGVESRGMLLAADLGGRPIVATFEDEIPAGTQVR